MWIIKSFKYAVRGFMIALRGQRNMKIHLVAVAVVLAAGFYFGFNYVDWCLVALAIGLVVGLEVMNTSIEELVDFVSPEKRKVAGRIKDLAAAAVLVGAVAACVVGVIIILSKI
jgi:diacylglycerol kinase (ATP)